MDYLPVWSSPHQVSLRHANPLLLDPIYLLVQELLGLLHGFLKLVFLDLTRSGGNRVGEWSLDGCGEHVSYLEPSVASRIFVGNMLICSLLLDGFPYLVFRIDRHRYQSARVVLVSTRATRADN